MAIGIAVGLRPWESRQQAMMQINDPAARKLPADGRWDEPHVTREHDVIHLVVIEQIDHTVVVRIAARIADELPLKAKLLRNCPAGRLIADQHGRGGAKPAVANGPENG